MGRLRLRIDPDKNYEAQQGIMVMWYHETRWYNGYEGGLQFNIFSYQTCGQNVNGDKGYYDGFVQGCMGTDSINTQELCESYVVECLRATSIDSSETCDADVDTTSSAWKLIMTRPS